MFAIMPHEFGVTLDEEGFPNNISTINFLRSADLFQGPDCTLRVVKKDEMLSEMLKSRARIGLVFDEVVDKYMKIARRVNTTKEEQEESDRVEAELLEHPFLKNNVMKPIKTKAAEDVLLWFTNDQMRDYLSKIRDAERGYSVKSHECPVPVKQPDGTEQPCCRTLVNELVEMRTGAVHGRNSEGKFVSKKEAWPIGDENGVSVGYHHHFAPKFGPTPARC
jgi:hypothetical protein